MARHQLTFQLRYTNPARLTVGLQGRAAGGQFDDDQNLFRLGRLFTLDALASRPVAGGVEMMSWLASESVTWPNDAPEGTFTRMGSPSPSPLPQPAASRIVRIIAMRPPRRRTSTIIRIRFRPDSLQAVEVCLQDQHGSRGIDALLLLTLTPLEAE